MMFSKYIAKKQNPPAKEYPFVLDPFQKTAIECLELYESVLVVSLKKKKIL